MDIKRIVIPVILFSLLLNSCAQPGNISPGKADTSGERRSSSEAEFKVPHQGEDINVEINTPDGDPVAPYTLTTLDLGPTTMVVIDDLSGTFLPEVKFITGEVDRVNVFQKKVSDFGASIEIASNIDFDPLLSVMYGETSLGGLNDFLSANFQGKEISLLMALPEGLDASAKISIFKTPVKNVLAVIPGDLVSRQPSPGKGANVLAKPGRSLVVAVCVLLVIASVGSMIIPFIDLIHEKNQEVVPVDFSGLSEQDIYQLKMGASNQAFGKTGGRGEYGEGAVAKLFINSWGKDVYIYIDAAEVVNSSCDNPEYLGKVFRQTPGPDEMFIPLKQNLILYICAVTEQDEGIVGNIISPVDGMEMVYVPAGEFTMGSETGYLEWPPQQIYLDGYKIDKTEVTNSMYQLCVTAGGCTANNNPYGDDFNQPQKPAMGVTWYQAKVYCEWAAKNLPTEAQWEKAARGTDGRTYPWGEGIDETRASYGKEGCNTTEVGSYPAGASPYGALDMAGNVREWVADWLADYSTSEKANPTGPFNGDYRVMRGGSACDDEDVVRSASRGWWVPDAAHNNIGFRCALPDEHGTANASSPANNPGPMDQVPAPAPTVTPTPVAIINPNMRDYPLPGCNGTDLSPGAFAEVPDGKVGLLRSSPDLTVGNDNLIGYVNSDEYISVLDGPVCSESEIMWQVVIVGPNIRDWMQETQGLEILLEYSPPPKADEEEAPPDTQEIGLYYPVENCMGSYLRIGDTAMVSYGGGANNLRSKPVVSGSSGIIGQIEEGEWVRILGGPVCYNDYLMWQVETDGGIIGWTAEGKNGDYYLELEW